MTQEALKLALEALEQLVARFDCEKFTSICELEPAKDAITAIKEALAQTQEPVAWQFFQGGKWHNGMEFHDHRKHTIAAGTPVRDLYATPPQRTEQNFCSRCGKRTTDLTTIHTCTPPQEKK